MRRFGEWLLIALAACMVVWVVALFLLPGAMTRSTLSASVASTITSKSPGSGYDASCISSRHGSWRCVLTTTDQSDSGITYAVAASHNCWHARLVTSAGMLGLPSRASSCLDLAD